MKRLSVKQNLLWNTAGSLIYQGCQWLCTVLVVTLSTSYTNSGILAFAMAAGNVFSGLAVYNMRVIQVSDVKDQYDSSVYVAFRCVTIGLAFAICALYIAIISPGSDTLFAVLAYFLFKSDEAFAIVLYGIDQKASRMDYIGISQALRGILSCMAFSFILAYSDNIILSILSMLLVCACVTLFYDLPHSKAISSVTPFLTMDTCKHLLVRCAPAVAAALALTMVVTVARQWFGLEYGEEELGIYAAVATPCVIIQVLANYLYSPFLVPLSEAWFVRDIATFKKQVLKLLSIIGALAIACIAAAAIAGPWMLQFVFGPSINDYAWMIVPAIVAAATIALGSFATDLMVLMRHFGNAAFMNFVALFACVVLFIPFTQLWYMNGLNILIIVSIALGIAVGIVSLFFTHRRTGQK